MTDIIRVQNEFYILATSSLVDARTHVLKEGDLFAIFDRFGDIQQIGLSKQGIFFQGTRFLSRLEFRLQGMRPFLLHSNVTTDNLQCVVDLTNPDFHIDHQLIQRGTLHVLRTKFLHQDRYYEQIRLSNLGRDPVLVHFSLGADADFADIFEVRGTPRAARGVLDPPEADTDTLTFQYTGLDHYIRRTLLHSVPAPQHIHGSSLLYEVALAPQEHFECALTMVCELQRRASRASSAAAPSFALAREEAVAAHHREAEQSCQLNSSNQLFNEWCARACADLQMMLTQTAIGPYPYAGVPWFSTPFGRDGIITALQTLWIRPGIADGVLRFLAATQATEENRDQEAEPGKILHEMREGEMANLGEIPFARHYGSIDATPLFLMLAHAYTQRTADRDLLQRLWPHYERAAAWIDQYGDSDRDGFVEYLRHASRGPVQQGWKDSEDSVFHADGALSNGPNALCEVQGYVYAAKVGLAALAEQLRHDAMAQRLRGEAELLRERFGEHFWDDELRTYVLALDAHKRACRVRTSNAGHCLFTGIARREHAQHVAELLLADDFFSGWGVRTVAAGEARYNPMSYHNGSIWPHDNAIIAAGLARYGYKGAALRIFTALFEASRFFDLSQLPELFCGFRRRAGEGPIRYPVACAPQAWAAGALFMLLQASLGLSIDAAAKRITFRAPALPAFLNDLQLRGLRVGPLQADINILRLEGDVNIHIVQRDPELEVVIEK